MPEVRSFRIEGLAGREEVVASKLNSDVNVCFGANGSGKTSLLRILHSALQNDADLLKDVPFTSAEVVIYSFGREIDYTYSITKESLEATKALEGSLARLAGRSKVKWKIDPVGAGAWFHKYLPISRLYTSTKQQPQSSFGSLYSTSTVLSDEALESQFAENLDQAWKDYFTDLTAEVNKIQEAGLARNP